VTGPGREADLARALRRGWGVFAVLGVLAIVEWYAAVARVPGLLWYLVVIQVVEAGLIAHYFMHLAQLWCHPTGSGGPK
jgi:cytochrome c oxidase subunit IV